MEKIKNIFTAARLKKAGACLGVCAVIAGGAAWYHHQQKQVEHAQIRDAQNQLIETQAAQHDLALLSTDTVRTLAADAIGIDETTITYRDISLMDKSQHIDSDKKDKKKDSKHKSEYKQKEHKEHQEEAASNDGTTSAEPHKLHGTATADDYAAIAVPQTAAVPVESKFRPIYRVSCKANNVKYDLRIDAVTGQVLKCTVGK